MVVFTFLLTTIINVEVYSIKMFVIYSCLYLLNIPISMFF